MGKAMLVFRLSRANKCLLLESVFCMTVAKLLLVCLPFRQLSECLTRPIRGISRDLKPEESTRIGDMVERVNRHLPWTSKCFDRAIAMKMMLRRRRIVSTLCLGIKKNNAKIVAHAWLVCDDKVVTGDEEIDSYACIATFTDGIV
jgi:hypothetical protein